MSSTPPEYQTDNIKVKMQILYGTNDLLITPKDVELLIHKFDNQFVFVVKMDNWIHIDFMYAKEANKKVYQKIIEVMVMPPGNDIQLMGGQFIATCDGFPSTKNSQNSSNKSVSKT